MKNSSDFQTNVTVQEAIVQTIRGSNVKVLAGRMRMPEWKVYQISDGTARKLRAEEVAAFTQATESHQLLDVICRQAGGAFVPLPSGVHSLGDDYSHASDALAQFGQTMQAYASALSDGRVTREEAEQVHREGHEAITAILALINHAETKATSTLTRKVDR